MSDFRGSRYGYARNPSGFYADAIRVGQNGERFPMHIFKSNKEHISDNTLRASSAYVAIKNGSMGIAYTNINTVVSMTRSGKPVYGDSAEVRLLSSCRKVACGRCNAYGYNGLSSEYVGSNYFTCAYGEHCNLCGKPYV